MHIWALSNDVSIIKTHFLSCLLTLSSERWSGVEWSGVEWSGVEWSGVECISGLSLSVPKPSCTYLN